MHLLDAAAPGLIFGVMIIFMIVTIAIEAVVMILLKYNKAGKAFLDSFVINLVSMGVGFILLLSGSQSLALIDNFYLNLFLLFLITVVAELIVLYLLNRKIPVSKTVRAAFIINLVSYLIYFLFQWLA